MGMYKFVRDIWKKPKDVLKNRLVDWRKEPAVLRINRPTRIDRARALGYRAKPGFVMVRARVKKGVTKRPKITHARRPKRYAMTRLPVRKSKKRIAEERVANKYRGLEVLNSYWVGDDSKSEWYEIILVDPNHPAIFADRKINWICKKVHKGRAARGLTGAGKKSRGLSS